MDLAMLWWSLALGCGIGAGRIEASPQEIRQGPGWALAVPAGASVRVEPGLLQVDAADGRRWFDISWTDDLPNESTALQWAQGACAPALLDEGWGDEHRYAVGGLCGISERRHWLFLVEERVGGRTLRTAFFGDAQRLPYEDAWVDFARTALSLGAGPPIDALEAEEVRAIVRDAAALPPGTIPVPGGGLLSTRILPKLGALWAARDASPPAPF